MAFATAGVAVDLLHERANAVLAIANHIGRVTAGSGD